ncbi:hypothetical protein ACIG87_25910 [Micromonospora sp. NPDC051925]|uniref:hypothetical protein n=1 Tax=Micromonospora sp. NPDC051925 TaxID=3364288 RepID=UPI0037C5DBBA
MTRFLGPFAEAERTVEVLAQVRARGLPVARHDLVVDHDHATGVVDWNLGASRGDRLFALIQTRIDREWFVRATDADPVETAAAVHLDEILAHRIAPATLRLYWAHWMLRQLTWAVRSTPPDVVDWHLDMIETRLA